MMTVEIILYTGVAIAVVILSVAYSWHIKSKRDRVAWEKLCNDIDKRMVAAYKKRSRINKYYYCDTAYHQFRKDKPK